MGIIEKFSEFMEKPETDKTTKEVMTKPEIKKATEFIRTLGNVRVAAEAQRIFNPMLPPTLPKGPTSDQMSSGVVDALKSENGWGSIPK